MHRADTVDVAIVGAGIVGAAIAHRVAQRGLSVTVLEAQDAPARGSTGRSAAGVRVQFGTDTNVRLSLASITEYAAFEDLYGASSGYRPQGYLFLVPEDRWDAHANGLEVQRRIGAPVETWTLDRASALVPFDRDGVAHATYGPIDGVVDPDAITRTYLREARSHGATVRLSHPLLSAAPAHGGGWVVEVPGGTVHAGVLVNAAGAWAGQVAARCGLELPVEPVRRIVWVSAPFGPPHTFPLTIDVASGVYLRSEGERLLFGRSNPHETPGFVEGVDWSWLEPTLAPAMARFPWMAEVALDAKACWWGYYEVTPDHDAILGRRPDVADVVDAAGFSGHGVQHAAAVGVAIAEEIVDGRASTIDIGPLRHTRFTDAGRVHETNVV